MRGIYTEYSGVARRAYQMYVGVNGVARRVIKGYVGVNGVARRFHWVAERKSNIPGYGGYGTGTVRDYFGVHNVARVGGYVLFINNSSRSPRIFVAYNSSLVWTSGVADEDDPFRFNAAVTQNANYAIVAGGESREQDAYRRVLAINSSLVVTRAANMAAQRTEAVAGEIGNYAVIGGGFGVDSDSVKSVEAYNLSLTRTSAPNLRNGVINGSGAAASAGGAWLIYYQAEPWVESIGTIAYSPSLARSAGPTIGGFSGYTYGVSRGDYAVFGNDIRAYALTSALAVHGSIDMYAQFQRKYQRGQRWAAAEGAAKSLVAMGDWNIGIDDNLLTSRLGDSYFRLDNTYEGYYAEYSAGYINGYFIINGGTRAASYSFNEAFIVKEA